MEISFPTSQDALNRVFELFLLLALISSFDLATVTWHTVVFYFTPSLQRSTIFDLLFKFSVFLPKEQLCFKPLNICSIKYAVHKAWLFPPFPLF